MANNLSSNVDTRVLKTFTEAFMAAITVSKTVNREILAEEIQPDTGSTVYVKRPTQATTKLTPDGDLTSESKDNIIAGRAAGTVQNFHTGYTGWTSLEQATQLSQLEKLLEPHATQLVVDLEQSLLTYMASYAGLASGSRGNAIDAWSDIAAFSSTMKALGVPKGNWYAQVDPFVCQNLADVQKGLFQTQMVDDAWKQATIAENLGGMRVMEHDSLQLHTAGTLTSSSLTVNGGSQAVAYTACKDTMTQTINLSGLGAAKTITAGAVLQFDTIYYLNQKSKVQAVGADGAGLPFTCTVVSTATADGSGDATVTISPPIIVDSTNPQYNNVSAEPANGASVTVLSGITSGSAQTSKPAIFYHEDAFALATVELPKLHSIDSMIMNVEGFSIRQHKFSNGVTNEQSVRWDILPVFASLNPMMAGKGWGRA